MSIIEWKALERQQDAWLGYVGLDDVCAVLKSAEPKWPWQVQDRSGMLRAATTPARSFEEACWLAEQDVIGFIKSHDLIPMDAAKAAVITDRSTTERGRILEYWEWREASGWDDQIEPGNADPRLFKGAVWHHEHGWLYTVNQLQAAVEAAEAG